jgi:hypothetical protein
MTTAAHLGAMFAAAPIVVWVEDSLTRDYLSKAWNDDLDIVFFLAGNSAAVRPIVETARGEGINHVFGIVDRDLGTTNRAKWPNVMIFRLPRHELENYLLDQAAWTAPGTVNPRLPLPRVSSAVTWRETLDWRSTREKRYSILFGITCTHTLPVRARTKTLRKRSVHGST